MAVYFSGCITMAGYLADSQHRIDWLHQLGSVEDTGYDDFYQQMDMTIMGKRTFEEIQGLPDVESFYQATENFVFTHEPSLPVKNYQPVAGDVVAFVQQLDKAKNVFVTGWQQLLWVGGYPSLARRRVSVFTSWMRSNSLAPLQSWFSVEKKKRMGNSD